MRGTRAIGTTVARGAGVGGFTGGLALGLIIGLALGVVTIGFLAISAYQRGFADAAGKRKEWRAELVARRSAAGMPSAEAPRPPEPVVAPIPASAPEAPAIPSVAAVARKAS